LFFLWFKQNKHFKRRSGLPGQITPFLLVVLVILLVAIIATINIGRVSLDKTCSANAADAGSLAAASAWASALNMLTEINRDQIEFWFDLNYYTYRQFYYAADSYLAEARTKLLEASASAIAAAELSKKPLTCYTKPWVEGIGVAVLDGIAAKFVLDASVAVSAFTIALTFMQSMTDSFYEQQWSKYCAARDFMDDSYINARKTGLTYAFNNSCIPAKLSDSQNDSFISWMAVETAYAEANQPFYGSAYEVDAVNPNKLKRTCNWQDKISQGHTVTAELDLPKITSYELQHTVGSHSAITGLLNKAVSRSQTISEVLYSTATILGVTAGTFLSVFILTVIAYAFSLCCSPYSPYCCALYRWFCRLAYTLYGTALLKQTYLVSTLAALVALGGEISIFYLEDKNDQAYDDWAPDGIQSSVSCADAEDLMIVKIDGVTLPSWRAACDTKQTHPETSSGIIMPTHYPTIASSSQAQFDGGEIGMFLAAYYPRIVWTQ